MTPVQRREPYKDYRAKLLSPEQVKRLSTLRPSRVIADTALCWAIILASWTIVALWTSWWSALLAIVLTGTRFYALFIIGHDGLHGRLFENRRTNNAFNDIFIMGAIGAITRINNKNHLMHHLHLANPEDPDRHKHSCFNKSERPELMLFVAGLTSFLRSMRNVFFSKKSKRTESAVSAEKTPTHTLPEILLLCVWQGGLISGLTLAIGWWAYPVLWLLPVYAFAFLGDNLRSFAEHSHPEADEKADEHRLVTFTSNPLERLFVAPMNMNFHAVHHLWVSIPYYKLPEADALVRKSPASTGLEWRGSYLAYLLRYYLALPLVECRQKALSA